MWINKSAKNVINFSSNLRVFQKQLQRRVSTTTLSLWNVVEQSKVPLTSKNPHILTWYSCGPTVYNSSHIGHASSYIRQDVIRRIIERYCPNVSIIQIMGVTDVDEKIIRRSSELGIPWNILAKKYEEEFFSDLNSLNVKPPHLRARVSHFIPRITHFIHQLIKKDFAYIASDESVYFNTSKLGENYAKLRRAPPPTDEESNFESNPNSAKRNPKDFALWKSWKEGEPYWITPWGGKGRPGWHIECSAMATYYFGTSLDIHSGGLDLLFPHHENEETQCCARYDLKNWVSHWIHTGPLLTPGRSKMSKSLGNTILIRDFLTENKSGEALRMLCISHKYRKAINYNEDDLKAAVEKLQRFRDFISDCNSILDGSNQMCLQKESNLLREHLQNTKIRVGEALRDDFDTPTAIEHLLAFMKEFNSSLVPFSPSMGSGQEGDGLEMELVLSARCLIQDFLDLTGLEDGAKRAETDQDLVNPLIDQLLEFRKLVRDFSLSSDETDKNARRIKIEERSELLEACDEIRTRLQVLGIQIKDHKGGKSSWALKS